MAASLKIVPAMKAFRNPTKKPATYLSADSGAHESALVALQQLYKGEGAAPLIIQHCDDEQIWQQLDLFTAAAVPALVKALAKAKDADSLGKCSFLLDKAEEEDVEEDKNEELESEHGSEFEEDSIFSEDEVGLSGNESDADLKEALDKYRAAALGNEEDNSEEEQKESEEDEGSEDTDDDDEERRKSRVEPRTSKVDDRFFKLGEMEHWLEEQDDIERHRNTQDDNDSDQTDDEDIDYFKDFDEEEEETGNIVYKDFFDAPRKETTQRKTADDKAEDSEQSCEEQAAVNPLFSDDDSEGETPEQIKSRKDPLSSNQKRLKKMKEVADEFESNLLDNHLWQEKGEVSVTQRPANSLLETYLDTNIIAQEAPMMTAEVTEEIEKLIINRINSKAFDDVERKVRRVETSTEYRKRLELDQEKSKLSLAEVYEQEYLKQTQEEEEEKEDPRHVIINQKQAQLFKELDALAHNFYTPTQAKGELSIVKNVASIHMEEAAPATVSDASRLAPEEILTATRKEIIGKSERSDSDKKKERRKKKKRQKAIKLVEEKKTKRIAASVKSKQGITGKPSADEKSAVAKQVVRLSKEGRITVSDAGSQKTKKLSSTNFFNELSSEKENRRKRKQPVNAVAAKKYKL